MSDSVALAGCTRKVDARASGSPGAATSERTGWNRGETSNFETERRRLALKWKTQVDKEVSIEIESGNSMLTTPLVAQSVRTPRGSRTVLYTLSAANTIVALDAATGGPIWQRTIDSTVEPTSAANWICTNTSTATPVIDKATCTIYMIAADGRLHGLDLATGEAKMIPPPEFVTPFSRNWSLNLVDGVLYTTVGRGCGNGPVPGAPAPPPGRFAAAERNRARQRARALERPRVMQRLSRRPPATEGAEPRGPRSRRAPAGGGAHDRDGHQNPARPITRFFTSTARPNGAWSRAGLAWAHDSLLVQTADGPWEPAQNLWGQTLLRLAPRTLKVLDYFTPPNLEELNANDLDYGSGGTLGFTFRTARSSCRPGRTGPFICSMRSRSADPIIGRRCSL